MTNLDQFEDTRGFITDLKSHVCSLTLFGFWLLTFAMSNTCDMINSCTHLYCFVWMIKKNQHRYFLPPSLCLFFSFSPISNVRLLFLSFFFSNDSINVFKISLVCPRCGVWSQSGFLWKKYSIGLKWGPQGI
jgi:hypothetical protein